MAAFKLFLIRSAQFILKSIVYVFFKIKISGQKNLPSSPKALIVVNHSSYLDVPVLGCALYKNLMNISWVISKFNYKLWYLKWLYFIFKVIVVNGTTDKVKKDLEKNRWVVIFPEGGAQWCPPDRAKKKKPKTGAAAISLSTGVPIIPICISGADKVLPAKSLRYSPKHQINISIGKSFSLKPFKNKKISQATLDWSFPIFFREPRT